MLRQRALSAAVLVPPLLLALLIGGPVIVAVVVLATGLAALEIFRLLRQAGYLPLAGLGTVLAVALVLEAATVESTADKAFLLAGLGLVLAAVGAFTLREPRDGLNSWMATAFGALYVALLGFVIRLGNAAPEIPGGAALAALGAQRGWILLLVLTVWAYDTAAYFVGRQFGRRRFLTHISPAKTYAGLAGGLIGATVVSGAMLGGLGEPVVLAVLLGPLIGLAAQAGDLAESMIKRAAGAKDSGTLIPGHGGMLDRVDSFLFAAPAVTLYVLAAVR